MYQLDIISINDDNVTARMIPMEEHMYVDKNGYTIIEYRTNGTMQRSNLHPQIADNTRTDIVT